MRLQFPKYSPNTVYIFRKQKENQKYTNPSCKVNYSTANMGLTKWIPSILLCPCSVQELDTILGILSIFMSILWFLSDLSTELILISQRHSQQPFCLGRKKRKGKIGMNSPATASKSAKTGRVKRTKGTIWPKESIEYSPSLFPNQPDFRIQFWNSKNW